MVRSTKPSEGSTPFSTRDVYKIEISAMENVEDEDGDQSNVEENTTVSEGSENMGPPSLPPHITHFMNMNYFATLEDDHDFLTGPLEDSCNNYALDYDYLTGVGRADVVSVTNAQFLPVARVPTNATRSDDVGLRYLTSGNEPSTQFNGTNITRLPSRRSRAPPPVNYSAVQDPVHSPAPPNTSLQPHILPLRDCGTHAAQVAAGVAQPQQFSAHTHPTSVNDQVNLRKAWPWDRRRSSVFSRTDNDVIILPPIQSDPAPAAEN